MSLCFRRRHIFEIFVLERHPHCRLGNAVEIDIILSDKLINLCLGVAPVISPLLGISALSGKVRHGKGNRCPEGFGPYPYGKSLFVLKLGRRNAPLDISRKSEGHKGLALSETNLTLV